MSEENIRERINIIEAEILRLPIGSVAKKKINGREYYYHRISKNGHRTETSISIDEAEELISKIKYRKDLEKELKQLNKMRPKKKTVKDKSTVHNFNTYVRIGKQLLNFAEVVKPYRHRECYMELKKYIFGQAHDKVFILYGLRRTGKTTLIRQIILDLNEEDLNKTAFIQITQSDTLRAVNADLRYLEENGFKYVFLDEVTLMEDFIEGAALFSDIYASSGMKIILSGTDSLGFVFTKTDQLYDRCIMLHTTFIPYREFESVLSIKGIDNYIRFGGTMSMGGIHYNELSSFATKESTDEYIDSAIAHNIQHSLKYYQDGGHFRLLYSLYEKDELTSAINRVVEDINHRFTKDVLTRRFKSSTLSITARNLLRDWEKKIDILDNIDSDLVNTSIKGMLDILEKEEQTVSVDNSHAFQIKEYLAYLDLLQNIQQIQLPDIHKSTDKIVISQPGIRYAQTVALVKSLLMDEKFNRISADDRKTIIKRVTDTIEGRMMEDIVLLETKLALPKKKVFQLQFAIGEFDMVVLDQEDLTCNIYEIKHSKEQVSQQYQHLVNEEKCQQTEHSFGKIIGRYVIYRGPSSDVNEEGVKYINVEEYLKSIQQEEKASIF